MSNPNPPAGGPPLRALAMTLIALAIVFAGIGALSLSNSSSDSSQPTTTSAAATPTAARTPANQLTTAPSSDAAALPTASSPAATTTASASTTTASASTTTTSKPPSGALDRSTPVHVLNNSTVQGLANDTASKLTADGWSDVNSGNYSTDVLPKSAVYYGNTPGEQAAAQSIAATLGLTAQPRPAGMSDQPAGVIVILTGN